MRLLDSSTQPANGAEDYDRNSNNDDAAFHPKSAWAMVAILAMMLLMSFIDRFSLSVLVGPIKHDLQLSDTQIGLLLGTAFGVFYSTAGLPSGYLIDRYNRRNLLVAGVVVWSLMTVISGFSQNVTTLFIGRMGVGLGEAVLTPAAYSLIKDAFPERLRGRAYGFYLFGSSVGAGAAFVVAGYLERVFTGVNVGFIPFVTHLSPWQYVLIVIGAAGIPLAALGLAIREPARNRLETLETARLSAVLNHVDENRRIYWPLLLLCAVWGICIFSYGAWVPTALGRAWNFPATVTGSKYGFITMCLAPLAAILFSGQFDRLARSNRSHAIPLYAGVACILVAIPTAVGPLAFNPALTWICLGINIFSAMGVQLSLTLVLAHVTPGRMIGKMSACCFLCMNLVGLGFGPMLIAVVAEKLGSRPESIGHALSLVVCTGWLMVGALFLTIWRAIRAQTNSKVGQQVPAT
ncbi:MFS transporter [Paraburkholderia sp. MM5482-R1]|uniref:MFS transporter n=1 Tax=unclassified Paraburkholderia TaxID=2615204 RepID=UPI003D1B32D8